MRHAPDGPVEVPPRVTVFRTIVHYEEKCLGCGTCVRGCPALAIEARPPQADAAPAASATPSPDAATAEMCA
jgi:ferredoxin